MLADGGGAAGAGGNSELVDQRGGRADIRRPARLRLDARDKLGEAPTPQLACRSVLAGWVEGSCLPRNSTAVLNVAQGG